MSRTAKVAERKRVDLFILRNQLVDMEKIKEMTGKTRTDCVKEALGVWLTLMHNQGVL